MGYMTLTDHRANLLEALGNPTPTISTTFLDRWINFGYLELSGGLEFDDLVATQVTPTVASIETVAIPQRLIVIEYIKNMSGIPTILTWHDRRELSRMPSVTNNVPKKWTRRGAFVQLYPTPNGVYNLELTFRQYPTRLVGPADVSVLSDTWDQAIQLLATHNAMLSRNEENRAMVWLQRAVQYIASRATDEDLRETTRGLNLNIPLPPMKAAIEGKGA